MLARHILIVEGVGTPARITGLIQGVSPASTEDWERFLREECRDMSKIPLERFKDIGGAYADYYPSGSVFVLPGGNALDMGSKLGLYGEGGALSALGVSIREALNHPASGYSVVGSCAGAALLSEEIQVKLPGGAFSMPALGVLPEVTSVGPLQRGPTMHGLVTEKSEALPAQLGWDNIGLRFRKEKPETVEVVAKYQADSSNLAIVKTKRALGTGPHLEALATGSALLRHAEAKATTPFFSTEEDKTRARTYAKAVVRDFLRESTPS